MPSTAWLVAGAAALLVACPELPVSFSRVSLEQARALVMGQRSTVVEVLTGSRRASHVPGATPWRPEAGNPPPPPGISPGPVLVVGEDEAAVHRGAAALARAGFHPVRAFVARDAAEWASLYAVAASFEESDE